MTKPKVFRGEDRLLTIKVTHEVSRDPFDLTNWTKITAVFKGNLNNTVSKDTVAVDAEKATATHETVNFSAVDEGEAGNSIILTFNGVKTIQEVLDDWNVANPTNQAEAEAGTDLNQVLGATSLAFSGGDDGTTYVTVIDTKLGKIQVSLTETDTNMLRVGPDQSIKVIVDKDTERRIAMVRNGLDIEDPIV